MNVSFARELARHQRITYLDFVYAAIAAEASHGNYSFCLKNFNRLPTTEEITELVKNGYFYDINSESVSWHE